MYKNRDCEYTSITFDPKLIYGYENSAVYVKYIEPIVKNFALPAVHFNQFSPSTTAQTKKVFTILKNIITLYHNKNNLYEFDIINNLQEFWKLLYTHGGGDSEIKSFDKRNYERLRNILLYIENNYASKLTLEDIASSIHLCKGECCRLFKQYMNVSLFTFILAYRVEKSLEYLTNSDYSMSDIAANVGFSDSNYYSKVFTKIKGVSPTKYRKALFI
jgi:YesN/AraC family two-component response regulator